MYKKRYEKSTKNSIIINDKIGTFKLNKLCLNIFIKHDVKKREVYLF